MMKERDIFMHDMKILWKMGGEPGTKHPVAHGNIEAGVKGGTPIKSQEKRTRFKKQSKVS